MALISFDSARVNYSYFYWNLFDVAIAAANSHKKAFSDYTLKARISAMVPNSGAPVKSAAPLPVVSR